MTLSRYNPRITDKTDRVRGRRLMERRALWFAQYPLCVHCKAKGTITLATELDHINALCNGGDDDDSNMQGLCHDCHKAKTLKDLGITERKTIGPDGWPVD